MSANTVTLKRTIAAPAAEAYRGFTRSIALREWMCDAAQADARIGGRLYLWWNSGYYTAGEFMTLDPDQEVVCTWRGQNEPGVTRLHVSLVPVEGGTEVTLTHAGFGEGDAWAEACRASEHGWTIGMENLQSVLETGQDLRIVRRPMLGIYVGEFNPTVAAKLGVPVAEGMRLSGVVDGMGAQAAGLQADDVVVSLGGQPADNWPHMVNALQGRRAGDLVEVGFYRGSEQRAVGMTLSPRPLPEVPLTPAELAATMREIYVRYQAELAACFEGVSDAEASVQPAANEWSALETVGHLIATERENQVWIADLINDDERWSDRFENPTAVRARVAATAVAYPAVSAILDELRRNQAEVVAMLAALPPEFMAHKGSYWRLGYNLLSQPLDHVLEHAEQIRAAVQVARDR